MFLQEAEILYVQYIRQMHTRPWTRTLECGADLPLLLHSIYSQSPRCSICKVGLMLPASWGRMEEQSTVAGTQQAGNKRQCRQECGAPCLAIGSLILFIP